MASISNLAHSGYRGRLAPSPTGHLHVGHARTFWAAFQRAREAGGTLVMRMEDLDPDRCRSQYAEAALEDLRWLGIRWQEGPDKGGPFAPYLQSRRLDVYLDAWRRLVRNGYLYPCRCSRKDLESALAAPHESAWPGAAGNPLLDPPDDEPIYPGTCRPPQDIGPTANELHEGINWRFRVPDGEAVEFDDRNLGRQRFVAGLDFGDFVVWRRDGVPSYQLACVADDAAMGITEVVRGADLLKSTARQILLNRALDFKNPGWFHCSLVVDHNGRRLAKRHDALSLAALRQRGLTPMNILSAELPVEV
jgi:glutamyl-tRNA synthetase